MIKITDKYYISFEPMNIVLCAKKTLGEKSKTPGATTFETVGYYGNFESLAKSLVNSKLEDLNLDDDSIKTLQDIVAQLAEIKKEIFEKIEIVNKEGMI